MSSSTFFVSELQIQGIKSVVISEVIHICVVHVCLFRYFETIICSVAQSWLFICRVLLVDRQESRPAEWMARKFLGAFSSVFPTAMSIPITSVARAIFVNTLKDGEQKVEILENKAIYELGRIGDKK